MKNKGFTLIEMLGVFTILALILVISLPATTKNLKGNAQKKYDTFLKDLYLATETYVQEHRSNYPALNTVGGTANITIGTLKQENLIKEVVDKPDGTKITDSNAVQVKVNSDNTFEYTLVG